jgi:hypothetical protein
MPSTPVSGVLISWLIAARNSVFARSAASACPRAAASAASRRLCSVTSMM